jgi:hypothetical protein
MSAASHLFVGLIGCVALSCPFLVFLDYHKRRTIHRAVIYVLAFFTTVLVVASLPGRALLILSGATPVWLFGLVALIRSRGRSAHQRACE